jgi:hypothetical protein
VTPKVKDSCGVCGGKDFASPPNCSITDPNSCVEVAAPPEIGAFKRRFATNARLLYQRLVQEAKRAQLYRCPIDTTKALQLGREELNFLLTQNQEIFNEGKIRVCGDTCVTVAYAERLRALRPTVRKLSNRALKMAKQVADCINPKGRPREGSRSPDGAGQTVQGVDKELRKLIDECRKLGKICRKR